MVAFLKKRAFTYKKSLVVIIAGFVIGISSLLFTDHMAHRLREKEQSEVELWSMAMSLEAEFNTQDMFTRQIINSKSNIPFIVTNEDLKVLGSNGIPDHVLVHPDLLRRVIERFSSINTPLEINYYDGATVYIFYGESGLLKMLVYFPLIQLSVIVIFIMFSYITFRSSKQNEQNRVWIGLAKETAHQLGTPTSSLLGWIEYLRTQPVDQSVVDEMGKDLQRLMKIVERFSKIGSETELAPANINEVVGDSVAYFRSRIPKNVTLSYNGLAIAPLRGMINVSLFEWVIENLLKNALDAMQGVGTLDVHISDDANNIYIDVTDSGKGIAKANFKRIFEPGFTTKTRGWGLGLSLSRRIIEDYHSGRIGVHESEIDKGTTMRITLKKADV
ncbi:MAG: HAMP domain-containing histidine kinase [Rikenellaceae bacterium]|nr:HAMP domain-containing histidine kinase [Rikenellaceae bacterium]